MLTSSQCDRDLFFVLEGLPYIQQLLDIYQDNK